MYDSYSPGFPWIKFTVLCVPLIAMMLFMADGLKWKLMFSLAVPIGVYLALTGKSIGRKH